MRSGSCQIERLTGLKPLPFKFVDRFFELCLRSNKLREFGLPPGIGVERLISQLLAKHFEF